MWGAMLPYIADAAQLATATELLERHGSAAAQAAASEADVRRDRGNAIGFCRWRQIERLVTLLSADCASGTLH